MKFGDLAPGTKFRVEEGCDILGVWGIRGKVYVKLSGFYAEGEVYEVKGSTDYIVNGRWSFPASLPVFGIKRHRKHS